jgi:hypothetical protein
VTIPKRRVVDTLKKAGKKLSKRWHALQLALIVRIGNGGEHMNTGNKRLIVPCFPQVFYPFSPLISQRFSQHFLEQENVLLSNYSFWV